MKHNPDGTTTPDLLMMKRHSELELTLWAQMSDKHTGVQPVPFWHRHVDGHECDFVFPGERIIVEVQGATWARGAHTRGAGYAADRMRTNCYQIAGWIVLEFTGDQVNDGTALYVIREAMSGLSKQHHSELNQLHVPVSRYNQLRRQYAGDSVAQQQIDVYDPSSEYHARLQLYIAAIKAEDAGAEEREYAWLKDRYPDI